jgi:hypothetical protein
MIQSLPYWDDYEILCCYGNEWFCTAITKAFHRSHINLFHNFTDFSTINFNVYGVYQPYFYMNFLFLVWAKYFANFVFLNLIIIAALEEEFTLWSSFLRNFLHSSFIIFMTLISNYGKWSVEFYLLAKCRRNKRTARHTKRQATCHMLMTSWTSVERSRCWPQQSANCPVHQRGCQRHESVVVSTIWNEKVEAVSNKKW